MNRTFISELTAIIAAYSPTEDEALNAIKKHFEKKIYSCCATCGEDEITINCTKTFLEVKFCKNCSYGLIKIKIRTRAKKTVKSLDVRESERGHTIRYYNKDESQDVIHFNVIYPKELDIRSKDEIEIEIPFYTENKGILTKLNTHKASQEIIKQLLEKKN